MVTASERAKRGTVAAVGKEGKILGQVGTGRLSSRQSVVDSSRRWAARRACERTLGIILRGEVACPLDPRW